MAVPAAVLLVAMGRGHTQIHEVDPATGQVGKCVEVLGRCDPAKRIFEQLTNWDRFAV